jgi:hypothetical protein
MRTKASVTATRTAAMRGSLSRRNQFTNGVSAKASRIESAKGMKMSRPK